MMGPTGSEGMYGCTGLPAQKWGLVVAYRLFRLHAGISYCSKLVSAPVDPLRSHPFTPSGTVQIPAQP